MKLLILFITLAVCPVAAAGNVADAKMDRVASWAAQKPVTVWCESDLSTWQAMASQHGVATNVEGFAPIGGTVSYLGPQQCANLAYPITDPRLGIGLSVLLHEATHSRGWADEALTECASRVLMYSALHDFYDVPWFSPTMRLQTAASLGYSLALPAAYQHGCDRL